METKHLIALGLFTAAPSEPTIHSKPHAPKRTRPTVCTQETHTRNRKALLRALHKYGHLRTSEISMCIYPKAKYGIQLAQRLARRLARENFILARKNALGGTSYVLADKGAATLELEALPAKHGRDITGVAGATFLHRTLATQYLLRRAKHNEAFGEYAISHNQAPITQQELVSRFGKIPDGLIFYSDEHGPMVDILEVEQSAKPMGELQKVLQWADFAGKCISAQPGSARIGRLIIAFDGSQGHTGRLIRAASLRWGNQWTTASKRVVLAAAKLGPGARWLSSEEATLSSFETKKTRV